MNHKLLASAVLAALLSASPMLQAQSLVGGATGSLRGAVDVGPGSLAGPGRLGDLGARDTLRETRGTLAGRRAELRELRRQQRLERVAAEAAAGARGGATATMDEGEGRLAGARDVMAGVDGSLPDASLPDASLPAMPAPPMPPEGAEDTPDSPRTIDATGGLATSTTGALTARGQADADANARASRRGASVDASASARGEGRIER